MFDWKYLLKIEWLQNELFLVYRKFWIPVFSRDQDLKISKRRLYYIYYIYLLPIRIIRRQVLKHMKVDKSVIRHLYVSSLTKIWQFNEIHFRKANFTIFVKKNWRLINWLRPLSFLHQITATELRVGTSDLWAFLWLSFDELLSTWL